MAIGRHLMQINAPPRKYAICIGKRVNGRPHEYHVDMGGLGDDGDRTIADHMNEVLA